MKTLAKWLFVAIMALTIGDMRTMHGKLVSFTNDTVIYQDTEGHLWETYRDKNEVYRLDKEVIIVLKNNYNNIIEDDIVITVRDR